MFIQLIISNPGASRSFTLLHGLECNSGFQAKPAEHRHVIFGIDLLPVFLLPGRPKAKKPPLGGSKPKARRGGKFYCRAAPRQNAPSWGSKPKAQLGAFFLGRTTTIHCDAVIFKSDYKPDVEGEG